MLAVPFLDTGFVVAKRIKYRRPVYEADSNHFHHRFHRIGFSQRRTVLYLYGWTVTMAGLAVALRFVPYSDRGDLDLEWSLVMGLCFALALAASVYLVLVLEILKLRRLRSLAAAHTPIPTRASSRSTPRSSASSRPASSARSIRSDGTGNRTVRPPRRC